MRTGFEITLTATGRAEARLFHAGGGLVSVARDEHALCVVAGRLHFRDELLRRLPPCPWRGESPAELALAAYDAWGPLGLLELEGELAAIVVDTRARLVFALRDALGTWPLYHGHDGGTLRVGTSLLDLARQSGRAEINRDYLGEYLMWPFATAEMPTEQTAFVGLRRIGPGQLLSLSPRGERRVIHENDWFADVPDVAGITLEEAGRQFFELFRDEVRQRLTPGGRTAAHLSGGMDSSAVVCLARDQMPAGQSLATLSLVYDMPSLAGEREYIQMVLDQGGPVEPHFLQGDGLLDFDWFTDGVPEHDEPYGGLCQLAMERRLIDVAAAAGATDVLTGGGAEVVAEGNPFHVADLLRRGRWLAALAEVRQMSRATGESAPSLLWRNGLQPALPGWLRGGLGSLGRRGRAKWPCIGMAEVAPWVRRDFARQHRLWAKGRAALGQLMRAPFERSASLFGIRSQTGEWSNSHLAGRHGIHTGRPINSPRLIRFCLALPRQLRITPGVAKPLLQEAMKGVLPEPIRTRRWKRHFNDVYRLGLSRRLGALDAMLATSALGELEMIDLATVRTCLYQVAAGQGEMTAAGRLNSTLSLVAWYDRAREALRQRPDVPSQVVPALSSRLDRRDDVRLCV